MQPRGFLRTMNPFLSEPDMGFYALCTAREQNYSLASSKWKRLLTGRRA